MVLEAVGVVKVTFCGICEVNPVEVAIAPDPLLLLVAPVPVCPPPNDITSHMMRISTTAPPTHNIILFVDTFDPDV